MRVYIVRHAQAKSEGEDPQRILTDMGRLEIKQTGSLAARRGMTNVRKIFHSGKMRAKETAELLAKQTNPDITPEESDGLKPNDDPRIWIERLGKNDFDGDIAIVGHLPHVARLATNLLCQNGCEEFFDTHSASVLCLEQDEDKKWLLKWMITPETA